MTKEQYKKDLIEKLGNPFGKPKELAMVMKFKDVKYFREAYLSPINPVPGTRNLYSVDDLADLLWRGVVPVRKRGSLQ